MARARCGRSEEPLEQLKRSVRAKTRLAIKPKVLVPQPCQVCGGKAQAHHPSYTELDAHLRVLWLCVDHHALEHTEDPRARQLELPLRSTSG